jgi:integrase
MGTINRLSDKALKAAKGEQTLHDGGGLYLKIGPTGGKSWVFRYYSQKKERRMGLGAYPELSLADAREVVARHRRIKSQGVDPQEERKSGIRDQAAAQDKDKTFTQCADLYIQAHEPEWDGKDYAKRWHRSLEMYAYQVIGNLSLRDITTDHVVEILSPIWVNKNTTADRLRGRIEKIFDWGRVRGIVNGQNPALWRGHLQHLLPKKSRIAVKKHHPALPFTNINSFMLALREGRDMKSRMLEFLILTAARTAEVRGARWDEIDGNVWTIPASRMKAKRIHRVPLSDRAMTIIEGQRSTRRSDLIFPGRQLSKPVGRNALSDLTKGMGFTDSNKRLAVPHGFRSTFRDWASETKPDSHDLAEMALAHSITNQVEASYRHGDLLERRKPLMQDWADFCDKN